MKTIEKIKLFNYKRFQSFEVVFDPQLNILVGDNEAGKSSILSAIDLVIVKRNPKMHHYAVQKCTTL